jgi:hypothetical protein
VDVAIYPLLLAKDFNQGLVGRLGTYVGLFDAIAVTDTENDKVGLRLLIGTLEVRRRTSVSLDDTMTELFDILVEFGRVSESKRRKLWACWSTKASFIISWRVAG